jgi:hypothetical protein
VTVPPVAPAAGAVLLDVGAIEKVHVAGGGGGGAEPEG